MGDIASRLQSSLLASAAPTPNPDVNPTDPSPENLESSAGPQKPNGREEFVVAIFCALPMVASMVQALFDLQWDPEEYGKGLGDKNSYTIGQIAGLKTVLVHMSGIGKLSATTAASDCRISFRGIKLSLVVGTCGGVPLEIDENEIVLGDVVVSDGLVEYDFGRQYPGQFVRKKGPQHTLGRPAPEIRSLIAKLKSHRTLRELQQSTTSSLGTLQNHPTLSQLSSYPGSQADVLYESSYDHRHREETMCPEWEETCGTGAGACAVARASRCEDLGCDTEKLQPRSRLQDSTTIKQLIHFGAFASGDKVMKSGEDRDEIASEEGIVAFETEGAGIWEFFPCVVIKGVATYADSHDSKDWQGYAAASAAACACAFLRQWDENCGFE